MNASYTDIFVERAGADFEISAQVENVSPEAWRADGHFAFGVHIFDRESETLIIDGPRMPLAGEILPGESLSVSISFEMPREPGRYRIFLSPMAEGQAWFYEHGWHFVLIEAVVNDAGEPAIERTIVANA